MKAGFAEIDITPPIGTHKMGWIIDIVSDEVLDPLYARAAVFENGSERIGFIQLDTLSIRWTNVERIRKRLEKSTGLPGGRLMVSASHNHAGPAIAYGIYTEREDEYVEWLIERCVEVFQQAVANSTEAEIGVSVVQDTELAKNRRVLMRDGTAKTHGRLDDPDAVEIEGPIDPEAAVIAARDRQGKPLGCCVNYACHPTHHGGETTLSAGFPGVLAKKMKDEKWPVTLFLNGACGNLHHTDPAGGDLTKEEAGARLAEDALRAIGKMAFHDDLPLGSAQCTVELPYREPTQEQVEGTAHGAQRFIDSGAYDSEMPKLLGRIKTRVTQPAEVQVLSMGDHAVVGIPAEYFVEHGLRIKKETLPTHTLVVSCTNGMVGYVPTRRAFEHGGYETTFRMGSRLAPEAGDILADAAIELVKGL